LGEPHDELLDAGVEFGDVGGEGVDAAKHGSAEEGVVGLEPPGQCGGLNGSSQHFMIFALGEGMGWWDGSNGVVRSRGG